MTIQARKASVKARSGEVGEDMVAGGGVGAVDDRFGGGGMS